MAELTVGGAQIALAPGDVQANIQRHRQWIEDARSKSVDLLVFPELSLTGYQAAADAPQLAMGMDAPELIELANLSAGMTSVVGFIEEGEGAQFYNSVAVLRDGQVLSSHRKVNLPTYGQLEEGKYFAPGSRVQTHPLTSQWRYSTLICADVWNPDLVHRAALDGASLLIVPIASAAQAVNGDFSNPQGWQTASAFYSMMYAMPVVTVNSVGEGGFYGGSAIYDSDGTRLAHAGSNEELMIASVSYARLRECRFRLPTVRDARRCLLDQ